MSCPKCEPQASSRRWLWWLALALLVSAGAWLEQGRVSPSAPGTAPATAR